MVSIMPERSSELLRTLAIKGLTYRIIQPAHRSDWTTHLSLASLPFMSLFEDFTLYRTGKSVFHVILDCVWFAIDNHINSGSGFHSIFGFRNFEHIFRVAQVENPLRQAEQTNRIETYKFPRFKEAFLSTRRCSCWINGL